MAFRSKRKLIRLEGGEFVRRFLLHVLPSGFRKIRHYAMYAPGLAGVRLELARALLPADPGEEDGEDVAEEEEARPRLWRCPVCGERQVRRMNSDEFDCESDFDAPGDESIYLPRGPP